MRHAIPVEELRSTYGPAIDGMAAAVERCVHCGFCLATCPTYQVLGEEMDSPRGRIVLMKDVLEGGSALEDVLPHIDPCLGCLACETSCPSGVEYGHLLTPFRAAAEERRADSGLARRLRRALLLGTLSSRQRFRWVLRLGKMARHFPRLVPSALRPALRLVPEELPSAAPLAARYPARGETRARVFLLVGCAAEVLAPQITRAAIAVLTHHGVEVEIPKRQGCCGALAAHAGDAKRARALAETNLADFAGDIPIVTTAAGCGSAMREYGHLFAGRGDDETAAQVAGRTVDIARFLADLGPLPATGFAEPLRVVYQDACHLAHAQREREAPRTLLRAIPNLELLEPRDSELCCGSAGVYNLQYPAIAAQLGRAKATSLAEVKPSVIATGNIGCRQQIELHLAQNGFAIPVLHTIEVLARAYGVEANPPAWPPG